MRTRFVLRIVMTLVLGIFVLVSTTSTAPALEGSGNAVVDLGSVSKSVIIDFTFTGSGPVVVTPIFTKDKRPTAWLQGSRINGPCKFRP
jgi:hypothetical protein